MPFAYLGATFALARTFSSAVGGFMVCTQRLEGSESGQVEGERKGCQWGMKDGRGGW